MAFDYGEADVWITDLVEAPEPGRGYPMCAPCADRMTPPIGWRLSDRRTATRLFAPLEVA